MADDWDLQAVVRGCSSSTSTTTTTTNNNNPFYSTPCFTPPEFYPSSSSSSSSSSCFSSPFFALPDPMRETSNVMEELHELYKPFFPKSHQFSPLSSTSSSSSQTASPISSSTCSFSSFLCSSNEQRLIQMKPQQQQPQTQPSKQSQSTTTAPRSKKRKNQLKKVCQVPAESLSSDIWAWRKYGQKPIKGSPYPRGYYRCSSSKGCLARKQVERNRSDPGMFIVTYTAEHNHPAPTHRNSLAGSTRQKPLTSQSVNADDSNNNNNMPTTKPSSPATSIEEELVVPQSTTTESKEGKESILLDDEEEDEFGFSEMAVSDDFFVGLEGLAGPVTGECYSDHFPGSFSLPWVANNAATAAGSI